MVVRRTVHALRQRPHDERRALAGGIAIAVVGILIVCWIAFSVRHISLRPSVPAQSNAASATSTQSSTPEESYTSPSSGIQLEYISATTAGQ